MQQSGDGQGESQQRDSQEQGQGESGGQGDEYGEDQQPSDIGGDVGADSFSDDEIEDALDEIARDEDIDADEFEDILEDTAEEIGEGAGDQLDQKMNQAIATYYDSLSRQYNLEIEGQVANRVGTAPNGHKDWELGDRTDMIDPENSLGKVGMPGVTRHGKWTDTRCTEDKQKEKQTLQSYLIPQAPCKTQKNRPLTQSSEPSVQLTHTSATVQK
jgi:hypothetical protein